MWSGGARIHAEPEAVDGLRRRVGETGVVRALRASWWGARDEGGVEVPVAVQRQPDALAAARAALDEVRNREVAAPAHEIHGPMQMVAQYNIIQCNAIRHT